MQTYIPRIKGTTVAKHLTAFPAVVLLGARQVGKSALARKIISDIGGAVYLDLEDPRDFAKLQDPLAFLDANRNSLICLDEIQRYSAFSEVIWISTIARVNYCCWDPRQGILSDRVRRLWRVEYPLSKSVRLPHRRWMI
jgi:hypothetical protein